MSDRLRAVVATPLNEELCALIERLEPRIDLVRDQSLLPPQRASGDHEGDPSFTRTAEQQARFEQLLDSAEALFGLPGQSGTALRRTVRANAKLRWVHTTPAGGGGQVRSAELTEEELQRVAFSTSAGAHAEPLAEFAVLGLLAGMKDLPRLEADKARHAWGPRRSVGTLGGRTVVVVGLGNIGRATARKLSLLGMRVIGVHRRHVEAEGVEKIVPVEQFAEAVSEADAVVLTLPGTDATKSMLSRDVLAHFRAGTLFVNVGRGTTVDEVALVEALQDGRIGYAALDVFAVEPLPQTSPIWDMPNVLVSPHTVAQTLDEERYIAELFAANATRLLDGEPLVNRVDTVEFY
ncbi:D-2-hydroxyacid dehydrogenase [Glaciihabitans sp. UYNi722]|uniref:D-2-hydroxyacid dehydrogenase n=1 Tax=Glaciihabitans sp. UYNi722 TaxID=3156344 RepID=UPI00339782AF